MNLEHMSTEELDIDKHCLEADVMYLEMTNRDNTQEMRDTRARIKQIDAELARREAEGGEKKI